MTSVMAVIGRTSERQLCKAGSAFVISILGSSPTHLLKRKGIVPLVSRIKQWSPILKTRNTCLKPHTCWHHDFGFAFLWENKFLFLIKFSTTMQLTPREGNPFSQFFENPLVTISKSVEVSATHLHPFIVLKTTSSKSQTSNLFYFNFWRRFLIYSAN